MSTRPRAPVARARPYRPLVLAAVALAAACCGDDDDGPPPYGLLDEFGEGCLRAVVERAAEDDVGVIAPYRARLRSRLGGDSLNVVAEDLAPQLRDYRWGATVGVGSSFDPGSPGGSSPASVFVMLYPRPTIFSPQGIGRNVWLSWEFPGYGSSFGTSIGDVLESSFAIGRKLPVRTETSFFDPESEKSVVTNPDGVVFDLRSSCQRSDVGLHASPGATNTVSVTKFQVYRTPTDTTYTVALDFDVELLGSAPQPGGYPPASTLPWSGTLEFTVVQDVDGDG